MLKKDHHLLYLISKSNHMESFNNTEIAFQSKSKFQLRKAYYLFKIMGNPSLSKLGTQLSKLALKFRLPISRIIKKTVFQQFCGGENIDECYKTIDYLSNYNIKSIIDYSVEGKSTEADFNRTMNEVLVTLDIAKNNKQIPFVVFKCTGIGRAHLLEKVNLGYSLSTKEQEEYNRVFHRMDKICKKAHLYKVPVMIDAEESWIQDTIDKMILELMKVYNKELAIVYNTCQFYRYDRLNYLKKLHLDSIDKGYFIGIKFVRGAYMEKERERAKKLGYKSPIHENKIDTDRDFNLALEYACEHNHEISICAGSHNEVSSLLLIKLMTKYKIKKNSHTIYFSQLLGMSDHISFNLASNGFNTVKYIPYGPVKEVLPYLIRRAEENTSIAGQTGRELGLIMEEIKRRS